MQSISTKQARHTRPPRTRSGVGFGSAVRPSKASRSRQPSHIASVISQVEGQLSAFKNDPAGYVRCMRMISELDFGSRAQMLKTDQTMDLSRLHKPFATELKVTDNGRFDYTAELGYWRFKTSHHMMVGVAPDGSVSSQVCSKLPDWEIDVSLCDEHIVHPYLANTYLTRLVKQRGVSLEDVSLWKRMVMQEFEAVASQLIASYRKRYPTQHLWSYTLCSDSERLVRQLPDVRVKDGLAYIIGSE